MSEGKFVWLRIKPGRKTDGNFKQGKCSHRIPLCQSDFRNRHFSEIFLCPLRIHAAACQVFSVILTVVCRGLEHFPAVEDLCLFSSCVNHEQEIRNSSCSSASTKVLRKACSRAGRSQVRHGPRSVALLDPGVLLARRRSFDRFHSLLRRCRERRIGLLQWVGIFPMSRSYGRSSMALLIGHWERSDGSFCVVQQALALTKDEPLAIEARASRV